MRFYLLRLTARRVVILLGLFLIVAHGTANAQMTLKLGAQFDVEGDGKTHNVGGFGGQLLAGVELGEQFLIEGQYKVTDLEDRDSQKLFTFFFGLRF